MMIGLIPGKKEHIGIDCFKVLNDHRSWPFGPAGITGQITHHDGILVNRVPADNSLERSFFIVSYTVRNVLGRVPVFDPEMSGPSGISDPNPGNLFPCL